MTEATQPTPENLIAANAIRVVFSDVVAEGLPCITCLIEAPEDARTLAEPTPAMWMAIYISHQFNNGSLMDAVQEFVRTGQFKVLPAIEQPSTEPDPEGD